ncbi:putative C6 transcription factor [Aspergillus lentulus]|uniref:C6 transcription factor n=1 Tax=Aspergillus lentulus TaxID=293939 RepID=A0ABQ0ZRH1_ASPLE|nr:putative C6 transcription factor [Aspergillus lentulus]GFF25570.1 putative C6 transcription factor [Aspergillus lentulus]GFF61708.1 putative C6 transcription factor [Aspergillus lentulus]GFF65104.1 putative C6 transcription factor [Aspergillus lentulus]GFG00619.1 putative C6 transcription factor [Aspergillus lentulus]
MESLQFGTDPFLSRRNQEGKGDSRLGSNAHGHQPAMNEQLPSVSELLTPSSRSSQSASPHRSRLFSFYHPTGESPKPGLSPHTASHHDTGLVPRTPQGRPEARADPFSRPTAGNLPSLSQMSIYTAGNEASMQAGIRTDVPHQQAHHSPFTPQGRASHDKELREDNSSPVTPEIGSGAANQQQTAQVRPHVVDERYIEGEGWCYIYADGSHCPKTIDGVPVNANWGVTKAGKPRKRLAQACLTCREKKIKCQPNLPKCDQCQKSGRECRFESAPRGHRAAAKANTHGNRYDTRDSSSSFVGHHPSSSANSIYSAVRASESSASLPGTNSQSPMSDASMLTPPAINSAHEPSLDSDSHYRSRRQSLGRPSTGVEDLNRRSVEGNSARATPDYSEILMEMRDLDPHDPLAHEWNTDPYENDAELTTHYVENYFTYVNDSLYYIFPRRRFLLWLRSCHTKSLEDKMLLYSMMTLGAIFSDRPDRLAAMKRASRTARYAVEHSRHNLSLQLAQSRIIMSLWYYAIGALEKSWDAVGAAVRTVCGLRYNVELGGVIVDRDRVCEYGLHPQALIECRRRTFWVAFLMDRLSCFYSSTSAFIPSQTAYLRMPCREEVFEAQQYTTVPYFQSFLNQPPASTDDELSELSAMALLIEMVSLWGEVTDHVFRLSLVPMESSTTPFEEFYTTICQRADAWVARLPEHLRFSTLNMERSFRARKPDPFFSIHLLYHATMMKLNRHARGQDYRAEFVSRQVRMARTHAAETLRIAFALAHYTGEYDASRIAVDSAPPQATILNPFLGYVILSAVDILSAAGLVADMPECVKLIRGGLEAVKELGRFWESSLPLVSLIEARLEPLMEILHDPTKLDQKMVFAARGHSLDSRIQKQQSPITDDLFYGALPHDRLFSALGPEDTSLTESNILWIRETD